jgi:hypothetical protein
MLGVALIITIGSAAYWLWGALVVHFVPGWLSPYAPWPPPTILAIDMAWVAGFYLIISVLNVRRYRDMHWKHHDFLWGYEREQQA